MTIYLNNPEALYQFFYLLAFVFLYSVIIIASIKRGYHLRSVLLMLTTITLFTVVGSRLFTISIEDWFTALNSSFENYNNRSSVGGLIFGLLALYISQRIFRFKRPMLELFAWSAPIAIGITKLGCLFNGCCYGLPFNGFWGIQYAPGTHAHYNEWFLGSIEKDALLSLSLHPVQLYDCLSMIVLGYIVWKTRKLWKKNFSAIIFALFLFFIIRFGVEFFRDHNLSSFSTQFYWGVWSYQWVMLGVAMLLLLALWYYEKVLKTDIVKGDQNSPIIHAEFTYITILSVLVYALNNLLMPYELLVIWILFIPAIILTFYFVFTESRLHKHRSLVSILLLTPFYVLAQTIPDQTPKIKQYNRIDLGASFGSFANEFKYNPQEAENACGTGTNYSYEYFKQVYQLAGQGIPKFMLKIIIPKLLELMSREVLLKAPV
ncbi:prolipoprotein diacylglyceryl transferase [Siansivirga zeaxanthinifaciens]|nr:prolipoprotein diacylglyceryl transferase family protein [Siansivirga zeaxanthinifaciens]